METVLQPAEVVLRLFAAVFAGMTLGIDRDIRGKPTGLRTLGLVCLGAALATVATVYLADIQGDANALSRVVQGVLQGVLTGVAFLGAGAVLRRGEENVGLTTAANVFVTACIGIACGMGEWWAAFFGWFLAFVLLVLVQPVEKWFEKMGRTRQAAQKETAPAAAKLEPVDNGRIEKLPNERT